MFTSKYIYYSIIAQGFKGPGVSPRREGGFLDRPPDRVYYKIDALPGRKSAPPRGRRFSILTHYHGYFDRKCSLKYIG